MKAIYFQVHHSLPAVAGGYWCQVPAESETHYWPWCVYSLISVW